MKGFLFDENLPARLTFDPGLPVVSSTILGASPSDTQIWEHARREELVVVTKDADFSGRIILQSPRPGSCICGSATCDGGISTPCWRGCGRRWRRCSKPTSW
jgi:predicted nuclease of predicted toxin-antitoxin system